jgi:hypothetical protein
MTLQINKIGVTVTAELGLVNFMLSRNQSSVGKTINLRPILSCIKMLYI